MNTQTTDLIDRTATALSLSPDAVIVESIESLLEQRLLQLNRQVMALADKYAVKSVTEMEARYQDGSLSEIGSWDDFQQLDHLEYDRDQVQDLLILLRAKANNHKGRVLA